MSEQNPENETLDTNEEVTQEETQDERDIEIAELKEKLKSKSIEARLAKKETKTDSTDSRLEELKTLAFEVKGIVNQDDKEIIEAYATKHGVSITEAINDDYVKFQLEKASKVREIESATVSSSNRGESNVRNTPDYWIKKGELPADAELRRKVVNRRIEIEKQPFQFSN